MSRSRAPHGTRRARGILGAVLVSGLVVAALGSSGNAAGAMTASVSTVSDGPGRAAQAGPAAARRADCPASVLVGVTGSSEGSASVSGARALGHTLGPAVNAVVRGASQQGRRMQVVPVVEATKGPGALRARGRGTDRADRVVTRASWAAWHASVPTLVRRAGGALDQSIASCPDALVFLAGYAQGAEAVHRLLALRATDADLRSRLAGTLLISDGARRSRSRAQTFGRAAATASSRGITTVMAARARVNDVPLAGGRARVLSVCSQGDLVCDFGRTPFVRARATLRSYGGSQTRAPLGDRAVRLGSRAALRPYPSGTHSTRLAQGRGVSRQLTVAVDPAAQSAVRWQVVSGLPAGLSLSARGVLSGTPTTAGDYRLDYSVRNPGAGAASRPTAGRLDIVVGPDLAAQVSSGGRHSCAVRADGSLWCWGANFLGQLGLGDKSGRRTPARVGTNTTWVSVSGGGMHTCAIQQGGTLWCWGSNNRGQLGLGNRTDAVSPRRVGTRTDWRTVSAGWTHTCAVRADHSAWCWGDNAWGELGDGTNALRTAPRSVSGGGGWSSLSAGGYHTCGVRTDGSASCWGRNLTGELGTGIPGPQRAPTPVAGGADWRSVEPSWSHTCGVRTDGSAWCWGADEEGQLGTGFLQPSGTPVRVAGDHDWSSVTVGVGFGCGIDTGATLWCWGTSRYGQVGDGSGRVARTLVPTVVAGAQQYAGLDAGWLHVCASGTAGGVRCWGENEVGAVGDGTDVDTSTPTDVAFVDEAGGSYGRPAPKDRYPGPAVAPTSARTAGTDFTLVSINALGSNHTAPGADAADFAPARVRGEWTMDHLSRVGASIVGFQEIQRDQLGWFLQGAGSTYDVWPGTALGSQGVQTSIAWRQADWSLVATHSVEIPFIKQKRLMPLVRLRNRHSGRTIWVMNIHNAPQGMQKQRDQAVALEIAALKKKALKTGDPVFLIGDFNERAHVFCEVTAQLPLVAAKGGSRGGRCTPPDGPNRVDWIFGSPGAAMSDYREDRSTLVQRITDHAVLQTRVSLP